MNIEYKSNLSFNGVNTIIYSNNNLHSAEVSVYVRTGPIYEKKDKNGISHLLEHMFFRKLDDLDQERLYEYIELLGASLLGKTYRDFMTIHITVSPSDINEAVYLIRRIFSKQYWNQHAFINEKRVVLKQIEYSSNRSFGTYADDYYFRQTKYALPIMGGKSTVERLSLKALENFRAANVTKQNACIIITGNCSHLNNEEILCQSDESLNQSNVFCMPSVIPIHFKLRSGADDYIINVESEISDIWITFDVDFADRYFAELISSVLGEGLGSALSLLLREQLQLTDEVASRVDLYSNFCKLTIELSVDTKNLIISLNYISSVINNIKEGISPSIYHRNIKYWTEHQRWLLDNPKELNFIIGWRNFVLNEDFGDIEGLINRYASISQFALSEAANRLLKSSNLSILITNNRSIIPTKTLRRAINNLRNVLI